MSPVLTPRVAARDLSRARAVQPHDLRPALRRDGRADRDPARRRRPLVARPQPWSLAKPLLGILACMVTARTAAMAFNRLVDRAIDAENPRTAQLGICRGARSGRGEVLGLVVAASAVGFIAATLLFLPNWLPLALSLPVLAWLLGYSFAKRFTSLAHLWLGAALGPGAGRRLDRPPRRDAPAGPGRHAAGGDPRPGRHHLGGRLRHHLRLPGCRLRRRPRPAQPAGPAGRAAGPPPLEVAPPGDAAAAGGLLPVVVPPARLDLLDRAGRASPPCWPGSTPSSGPTTSPRSTRPFSRPTPRSGWFCWRRSPPIYGSFE